MSYPRISWDMKFQPNANDSVQPVAQVPVEWPNPEGEVKHVTVWFNHTQEKVFFECEGAYGELVAE